MPTADDDILTQLKLINEKLDTLIKIHRENQVVHERMEEFKEKLLKGMPDPAQMMQDLGKILQSEERDKSNFQPKRIPKREY